MRSALEKMFNYTPTKSHQYGTTSILEFNYADVSIKMILHEYINSMITVEYPEVIMGTKVTRQVRKNFHFKWSMPLSTLSNIVDMMHDTRAIYDSSKIGRKISRRLRGRELLDFIGSF